MACDLCDEENPLECSICGVMVCERCSVWGESNEYVCKECFKENYEE